MTREEFINDPRISMSRLKKFSGSDDVFDMEQAIHDLNTPYTSKSMDFGKYFHDCLEHQKTDLDSYNLAPVNDGRRKEFKDWENSLDNDNPIVKPSDVENATIMMNKFRYEQPEIWFKLQNGVSEEPHADDEIKALLDLRYENEAFEWKTCNSTTIKDLRWDCHKFDYDLQAYHYLRATGLESFTFVFFKVEAPFQIRVYHCEPEFIQRGKEKWNIYKERYDRREEPLEKIIEKMCFTKDYLE